MNGRATAPAPRESLRLADVSQAISRAPIVRGRDAELASIGVQLDRVRAGAGAGAGVLVDGDPDMGSPVFWRRQPASQDGSRSGLVPARPSLTRESSSWLP
jgi:hypothetical protein